MHLKEQSNPNMPANSHGNWIDSFRVMIFSRFDFCLFYEASLALFGIHQESPNLHNSSTISCFSTILFLLSFLYQRLYLSKFWALQLSYLKRYLYVFKPPQLSRLQKYGEYRSYRSNTALLKPVHWLSVNFGWIQDLHTASRIPKTACAEF